MADQVSVDAKAVAAGTGRPARAARPAATRWEPYLYLLPMLLLLGVFTYWPLVHTAYLSLTSWNLNPDMPIRFEGVANYGRLVGSTLFEAAAVNTAIYIVASIPLKVLLPIPFAVFIWGLGPRGNAYRTILFLPTLISFVAVSIVFLWLLNPLGGALPQLAQLVGWRMGNVLSDTDLAIWAILLISTWKILGFNILLYLAGLSRINRDYIEAMRMDGASDYRIFRHLIWPLLTPTTFFVFVATTIFTIQQVFTPIDILTEGGPSSSTTNLFYMVYQYTFRTFDVGLGAAGTVLLFVLLFVITVVKVRLLDRRVHYQQ